jgi:MtN3 and saliva related transmembrane protein
METTTIMGLIAGFLTTGSFLPQIIKTIRTKDTKNISLLMYVFYVSGVILWLCYGYAINDAVLLITNSFSLLFGIILLIMKLIYK